jgi:hypothetical protein
MISQNRAQIILDQLASPIASREEAKAEATKTSLFQNICAFFSPSYRTYLESRKENIEKFVDTALDIQENFHLDTSKKETIAKFVNTVFDIKENFNLNITQTLTNPINERTLNKELSAIIDTYVGNLPDVNESNMCFGFNSESKCIVLKLMDGERSKEIEVLNFKDVGRMYDGKILENMPEYWYDYLKPPNLNPIVEILKKEGVFENSTGQFKKDAMRVGINKFSVNVPKGAEVLPPAIESTNDNNSDIAEKILNGAGKEGISDVNTKEDYQKVNFYLNELAQIDRNFTELQIVTFFKLFGQDTIPGRGGIPGNLMDVLPSALGGVDCTIQTVEGKLLLSSKMLMSMAIENDRGNKVNVGEYSWNSSFLIAEDGSVTKVTCKASEPHVYNASHLDAKQLFAIESLKKNNERLAAVYEEFSCKGINDRVSEQTVEVT